MLREQSRLSWRTWTSSRSNPTLCDLPNAALLCCRTPNIESGLLEVVAQGSRNVPNAAILVGDGIGKPVGFLNSSSRNSSLWHKLAQQGSLTWQDLVMLKFEIPMQRQYGTAYVRIKRAAFLFTMSEASVGRC